MVALQPWISCILCSQFGPLDCPHWGFRASLFQEGLFRLQDTDDPFKEVYFETMNKL